MTHTDERVSNLVGGKNNSGEIKFKKNVKVAMVIGGVFFCSYLVNVQTANANLVTPKADTVIIKHDTFVSNATAETFQKALAIKKTFDYARNILQNAFLIETIKYETDMAHDLPRPNSQTKLV